MEGAKEVREILQDKAQEYVSDYSMVARLVLARVYSIKILLVAI